VYAEIQSGLLFDLLCFILTFFPYI